MDKIIFNKPICNTINCCNNDPNYPNNCSIWTSVEGCCIADIQHPNYLQRALAWMDKHWVKIAVTCLTASVFICWTLVALGIGAKSTIDDLRQEQQIAIQQCGKVKR